MQDHGKYDALVKAAREAEKLLCKLRDEYGSVGDAPCIRALATALRALGE